MDIQINSDDKDNLSQNIKRNLGQTVEFSNGCWVSLNDDSGIFWGVSPYGNSWGCNSNNGYVESLINWIKYWDEPRTETGTLMNLS